MSSTQKRVSFSHSGSLGFCELLLLIIIGLNLVKSIYLIDIGFDPHHDYYAFAPGLFASEGLKPHLHFYTHYGAFDAFFKGLLLRLFGASLINLRISMLLLLYTSLLLVSYCCKRNRSSRIVLLSLVAVWGIMNPSSAASGETSYGQFLAWASDVAILLSNVLIILTFWQFTLLSVGQRFIGLIGLPMLRGMLLSSIFFTKFTIGLSMIAAVIVSDVFFFSRRTFTIGSGSEAGFAKQPTHMPKKSFVLNSCFLIFGGALGAFMLITYSSGFSILPQMWSDMFGSNYRHFSDGDGINLFKKLGSIFFNPFALTGFLAILIYVSKIKLKRKIVLYLLLAAYLIPNSINPVKFLLGGDTFARPTILLGYAIAAYIFVGGAVYFFSKDRHVRPSSADDIYLNACLPVGIFSLTQFYPLNDPFHVWWAVGSALPAAAFFLDKKFEDEGILFGLNSLRILVIAIASLLLISLLPWIFDLRRNTYLLMSDGKSKINYLGGVRSADEQTIKIMREIQEFSNANPKAVIFENSVGTFVELLSSPGSIRARARCVHSPLSTVNIPLLQSSKDLIGCMRELQEEGWKIVVMNHSIPKGQSRPLIGENYVYMGLYKGAGVPLFVADAGLSQFQQKQFGGLTYWELREKPLF